MTAVDMAREYGNVECMKLLEMASYRVPLYRVMLSLHCSSVVQDMAGISPPSTARVIPSSPLEEFCTNERYRHLIEGMMMMVLRE